MAVKGTRFLMIIPVEANEKLRRRIFKTLGEWLVRRLQLTDANRIQSKGKSRVMLPMEIKTAPNSKDIKRTNQKNIHKLHYHKPENPKHTQSKLLYHSMQNNAEQCRVEHSKVEQSKVEQNKAEQLLKIFLPSLKALNLNYCNLFVQSFAKSTEHEKKAFDCENHKTVRNIVAPKLKHFLIGD